MASCQKKKDYYECSAGFEVVDEKKPKGQRDLHCAFGLDLENDRVSRKEP